jgi:hypothetical protein
MAKIKSFVRIFLMQAFPYYGYEIRVRRHVVAVKIGFDTQQSAEEAAFEEEARISTLLGLRPTTETVEKPGWRARLVGNDQRPDL